MFRGEFACVEPDGFYGYLHFSHYDEPKNFKVIFMSPMYLYDVGIFSC